jgi:tripartite-type tricarboxylate transporter receptor subunit TctC
MKTHLKSNTYIISAAALVQCSVVTHAPAAYPAKAIRMVVGFPPGGGNDAVARLFGQKFSERFAQSVVSAT